MPAKNYMVVDPRRDHSFRVPRPDLTITAGAPNVCARCHADKTPEWAVAAITEGAAPADPGFHFAQALAAARTQQPDGKQLLQRAARDELQPAIARATAFALLGAFPAAESANTLRVGLNSKDPLERIGALQGIAGMPMQNRYEVAGKLLGDPVRSVRVVAMEQLAGINRMQLTASQQREFNNVVNEYIAVQNENADRAFSHVNLGNLYLMLGEGERAEAEYRLAIDLEPEYIPGYINLADYYRTTGSETEAEQTLRQALAIAPDVADVWHVLGLSQARRGLYDDALASFKLAADMAPDNSQFLYVYAIALTSVDQTQQALQLLESGHRRWPGNRELLSALMTLNAELGDRVSALTYGTRLLQLMPEDRGLQQFLRELRPPVE
jgi:Tfp pilus assembly protein PilF